MPPLLGLAGLLLAPPTPPTLTVFHRFREINISLIYFAYYSNIPLVAITPVRLSPLLEREREVPPSPLPSPSIRKWILLVHLFNFPNVGNFSNLLDTSLLYFIVDSCDFEKGLIFKE